MKFAIFWAGSVAVLVFCVSLLIPKYDVWFVYPAKRALINDHLKDPDSTKYRNERLSDGGLCGELNSKNGSGGYVGFRRFIAQSKDVIYLEESGPIIQPSHADWMLKMDKQIEILKEFNARGATRPSESDIDDEANKRFFADKWKAHCT